MTIGPEPRIITLWMSSRRGNALQEAVEEVRAFARAGARLGVVLHRSSRDVQQLEPLHGAVVQVHVRELRGAEIGFPAHRLVAVDRARPARAAHGEAMVL